MGTIQHHAVVATTYRDDAVEKIRSWISTLPEEWQSLFVFSRSMVNHYTSVAMMPDGSKEWWEDSDTGDGIRERFKQELKKGSYGPDEGGDWEWIEVSYGELGHEISTTSVCDR